MPTYPVINKETGEKKELSMTMVDILTGEMIIQTGIKIGMLELLALERLVNGKTN